MTGGMTELASDYATLLFLSVIVNISLMFMLGYSLGLRHGRTEASAPLERVEEKS